MSIRFLFQLTCTESYLTPESPASAYTNFWGKCNSHPLSRLAEFPGFLKWRQRNRKRPPKKGLRIKETSLRSWRKTKLAKGHCFCKSAMGIYGVMNEKWCPAIWKKKLLSTQLSRKANLLNVWKVFEWKKANMFGCGSSTPELKTICYGFFPRSCSKQILTMNEIISWNIHRYHRYCWVMECCGPWPLDL